MNVQNAPKSGRFPWPVVLIALIVAGSALLWLSTDDECGASANGNSSQPEHSINTTVISISHTVLNKAFILEEADTYQWLDNPPLLQINFDGRTYTYATSAAAIEIIEPSYHPKRLSQSLAVSHPSPPD